MILAALVTLLQLTTLPSPSLPSSHPPAAPSALPPVAEVRAAMARIRELAVILEQQVQRRDHRHTN